MRAALPSPSESFGLAGRRGPGCRADQSRRRCARSNRRCRVGGPLGNNKDICYFRQHLIILQYRISAGSSSRDHSPKSIFDYYIWELWGTICLYIRKLVDLVGLYLIHQLPAPVFCARNDRSLYRRRHSRHDSVEIRYSPWFIDHDGEETPLRYPALPTVGRIHSGAEISKSDAILDIYHFSICPWPRPVGWRASPADSYGRVRNDSAGSHVPASATGSNPSTCSTDGQ